jgi:hypothetical protein
VYAVDPLDLDTAAPPTMSAPTQTDVNTLVTPIATSFGSPRPSGARGEILSVIDAIVTRSGNQTFELNDVIAEMRRRASAYAEATIRTMVTSHLCANAPDHAATTYPDLERVGRGLYRRRR